MFKLAGSFLTAAALLLGDCFAGPETRTGKIEFIVTDLFGARIPSAKIELFSPGVKEPTKLTSPAATVVYGEYQARVGALGFSTAVRNVSIYQSEVSVRIELRVGELTCPPPPAEIGGQVKRNGRSGELWVKAVSLRGVQGGESRVSDSGYFLISGLEYTAYVLLVLEGDSVISQQIVKPPSSYTRHPSVSIDLSSR